MKFAEKYNFTRKYILDEHISSSSPRIYSSPVVKLLFAETGNKCGYCIKPLDWNNADSINSKHNQIAHIYGKRLFLKAGLPLSEKYHISKEEELNDYHNLIVLCDTCHSNYDKDPTYEKYVQILSKKEKIAKRLKTKDYIYYALEDILERIKDGAFDSIYHSQNDSITNYQRTQLERKLKYNGINIVKRNRTIANMENYFKFIREIIEEHETEAVYLNKYREVYQSLRESYSSKEDIIKLINSSLTNENIPVFDDVVPILTDYMIMNCEVLDNVTK